MTTHQLRRHRHRRCARAVVAAVVAIAGTGCAQRGAALGEGDDVDLCVAMALVDELPEPSADEPTALLDYAQGLVRILERIDPQERIDQREGDPVAVPETVLEDVQRVQGSAVTFRDGVQEAGDSEQAARDATNAFSQDRTYTDASLRITAWTTQTCGR